MAWRRSCVRGGGGGGESASSASPSRLRQRFVSGSHTICATHNAHRSHMKTCKSSRSSLYLCVYSNSKYQQ